MMNTGDSGSNDRNDPAFVLTRLRELIGQRCVAWRKGYGRSGTLHFGALIPAPASRTTRVYADHGTWILGLWDCDRMLSVPERGLLNSTRDGDEAVLSSLPDLAGMVVDDVDLELASLSPTLRFSSGAQLTLQTDANGGKADEQWVLQTLGKPAIGIYGAGYWNAEE